MKIHGTPDASDAARVRDYAAEAKSIRAAQAGAEALAAEIDRVYAPQPLEQTLDEPRSAFGREPALQKTLRDAARRVRSATPTPSAATG